MKPLAQNRLGELDRERRREQKLTTAISLFTQATGIKVTYEGTDAFATLIPERVKAGNHRPDITLFPQPGLMLDFAERGLLLQPQDRALMEGASNDY